MYVLKGTLAAAAEGFPAGENIFPADRCTWRQVDVSGGGYTIGFARFLANGTSALTLTDANLGYVGKSGRFVEIA